MVQLTKKNDALHKYKFITSEHILEKPLAKYRNKGDCCL